MTPLSDRYRKLSMVASDLMSRFPIEDIYVIMRRIDRIYPPGYYYHREDIDELEVQYDCYNRCWHAAKRVCAANAILKWQDRWPYDES